MKRGFFPCHISILAVEVLLAPLSTKTPRRRRCRSCRIHVRVTPRQKRSLGDAPSRRHGRGRSSNLHVIEQMLPLPRSSCTTCPSGGQIRSGSGRGQTGEDALEGTRIRQPSTRLGTQILMSILFHRSAKIRLPRTATGRGARSGGRRSRCCWPPRKIRRHGRATMVINVWNAVGGFGGCWCSDACREDPPGVLLSCMIVVGRILRWKLRPTHVACKYRFEIPLFCQGFDRPRWPTRSHLCGMTNRSQETTYRKGKS